jgi:hypothetical protein
LQRRQARSFEYLQSAEWRVKTESSIGLPLLQVRLPAKRKSVKRAQRTNHVQKCAFILTLEDKLLKTSNLELVEAAGVEPASEIAVSQERSCFVRFR